jgi:hypothetical protein
MFDQSSMWFITKTYIKFTCFGFKEINEESHLLTSSNLSLIKWTKPHISVMLFAPPFPHLREDPLINPAHAGL